MPKFKVRVINREVIVTVTNVEVKAKTQEEANAIVDEMIENSEIYDDGTWGDVGSSNEVERSS
jgi:hypothetical protein